MSALVDERLATASRLAATVEKVSAAEAALHTAVTREEGAAAANDLQQQQLDGLRADHATLSAGHAAQVGEIAALRETVDALQRDRQAFEARAVADAEAMAVARLKREEQRLLDEEAKLNAEHDGEVSKARGNFFNLTSGERQHRASLREQLLAEVNRSRELEDQLKQLAQQRQADQADLRTECQATVGTIATEWEAEKQTLQAALEAVTAADAERAADRDRAVPTATATSTAQAEAPGVHTTNPFASTPTILSPADIDTALALERAKMERAFAAALKQKDTDHETQIRDEVAKANRTADDRVQAMTAAGKAATDADAASGTATEVDAHPVANALGDGSACPPSEESGPASPASAKREKDLRAIERMQAAQAKFMEAKNAYDWLVSPSTRPACALRVRSVQTVLRKLGRF